MDNLIEFKKKYGKLSDAVIISVMYHLEFPSVISLEVQCRNQENNDAWELIQLSLKNVQELIFKEVKTSNQVIYEAIIEPFGGNYVFDFSPYSQESSTLEDFRRSNFVVHCTSFELSVIKNL